MKGRLPFYNVLSVEEETVHRETEASHRLNPCKAPIARVTTIMTMMTMTALFFVYHILAVGVSRFGR